MRKFNTLTSTEAAAWVATASCRGLGAAAGTRRPGRAGRLAAKVVQPQPGNAGSWRLIGQTHADHGADHDTDHRQWPLRQLPAHQVQGHRHAAEHPAPGGDLRQRRAGQDRDPQNIAQGGESRVIDLRGVGKRSIRRIDFWYDTQGLLKGKADVTVFGMK